MRHVIVGAGPVGRETAKLLGSQGAEVLLVTRSGSGPAIDGVTRTALDATDAERLTALATGAAALFNCANPGGYPSWAAAWPPLAASLLVAAERSGATLVTASNLYPYGPTDEPMVEGMPDRALDKKGILRAGMWAEAKARHDAHRLRAVEVRGSDYMGAGIGPNAHISRQLPTISKGRTAWVLGSPDQPHTWTDVLDMARTLVRVSEVSDTWGRVWHAPSNPPRTQREALTDVLAALGKPAVPVRGMPRLVTSLGGRFVPVLRELNDVLYMFQRPYVMSSTITSERLGLAATPWAEVCRRTALE